MTDTKQDAPAYDSSGNVRPTDARYTGADRVKITPQEQAAIREKEISDGWARVAEQQKALNAENDRRLAEAVASVSPAPATELEDDDAELDEYDGMQYAELQQEAKARELNAGGSADELRARLREDDAVKASS